MWLLINCIWYSEYDIWYGMWYKLWHLWCRLVAGLIWGASNFLFTNAVQLTAVANVLVILASNPMFSSFFRYSFWLPFNCCKVLQHLTNRIAIIWHDYFYNIFIVFLNYMWWCYYDGAIAPFVCCKGRTLSLFWSSSFGFEIIYHIWYSIAYTIYHMAYTIYHLS